MLVKINNKKKNTNTILSNCFYIMDLVKEHNLTGRLINVVIKDKALLSKWGVDYTSLVKTLKELGVLGKAKKDLENSPLTRKAYKYRIDKSRLLIVCLMCIGISLFDGNTIKKVSKDGLSFTNILNGIDKSLKDQEEKLFCSNKKYENRVITFVYESLQLIINYEQIQLINAAYDSQKTTALKFFENMETGISHYYSLKGSNEELSIPMNDDDLKEDLVKALYHLTINYFPISYFLSSNSLSSTLSSHTLIPLSSKSPFNQYLHNTVVYIGNMVGLMTTSLLSHRGVF